MDFKELYNWERISSFVFPIDTFIYEKQNQNLSNPDSPVVEEILKQNYDDYDKNYIFPFRREFNTNLLLMETKEAKENVLKYYLSCFSAVNESFAWHHIEILHNVVVKGKGTETELTSVWDDRKIEINKCQKYIIWINNIMMYIFRDIQDSCIMYGIDFFKITDDLQFDCSFIDCSSTLDYQERLKRVEEQDEVKNSKHGTFQARNKRPRLPFYKCLKFDFPEELAKMIKEQYNGSKGMDWAYTIKALQDLGLLQPMIRSNSAFYEAMTDYFSWDIGTRTSIFNYKNKLEEAILDKEKSKLKEITDKILKTSRNLASNIDNV